MSGFYSSKFFKNAIAVLLVLAIIFLFYQVAFLLKPVLDFISIVFIPILISVFFYYLLRPIVHFLERHHFSRIVAIIAIYFFVLIFTVLMLIYLVPILIDQMRALADSSVEIFGRIQKTSRQFAWETLHINLDQEIEQRWMAVLQKVTAAISSNLLDGLGWLTRLATILAVIPFIVFYLLKDDRSFARSLAEPFSQDAGDQIQSIIHDVDYTLSTYTRGLVVVSSTVGILLFIGYLAIGLDYALILAFLALIFNTIPFLGPFLAIIPALLVGLSQGIWATLKVAIVFIIVQQIESNIVSPQVIGQQLKIHPLTIILLLLAAGSLYGLLGLLLATPLYAVIKVVFKSFYRIYLWRYSKNAES